jgi:cell division protein FtsN
MEPSKPESKPVGGRFRWVYIVQVGSFLEKENAEGVRKKLENKGYSSVVKPFNHPSKGSIYVVQLVPVEDSKEASSLLTRIESEEKLKPLIIKVPAGD